MKNGSYVLYKLEAGNNRKHFKIKQIKKPTLTTIEENSNMKTIFFANQIIKFSVYKLFLHKTRGHSIKAKDHSFYWI